MKPPGLEQSDSHRSGEGASSPHRSPEKESPPSITCPQCGRTSYHPMDIQEKYCGHCHEWHAHMPPLTDV